MIDKENGRIAFDDGLLIWPTMAANDLPIKLRSEGIPFGSSGSPSFRLGTHPSEGQEWGVAVFFDNNRLHEVWIQQLSGVSGIWNIDNEKRRESIHSDYLIKAFPKNQFIRRANSRLSMSMHWGEISSELDLRGVQAILRIKYC